MKDSLPIRRLIPRWRSVSNTLEFPEASFGRGKRSDELVLDEGRFQNVVMQWRRFRTTGHLGDVLGFSLAPSFRGSLKVVAREALANPQNITEPQMAILHSLLEDEPGDSELAPTRGDNGSVCSRAIQENVKSLRSLLRVSPANPLVLLDFAQLQLSVGKIRKAERVLLTALSLSPNNRLILRTLARFYAHTGRFDEAHRLISRHGRTATDPWLMAAEISLASAAESPSKFIALGRRFIVDRAAGSADLSELAGAIGGEELGNGNVKRARDLFRIALLAPNDNVVAQVITDYRSLSVDLSQPTQRNVVRDASEARTLLAWNSLNTGAAEDAALVWHEEEPFSSRPLQFLTTLYAIENRLDWAENLARRGLIANPSDPSLMANLGYALAGQGKLEEAEAIERKLANMGDSHFVAVATATRGLIAMKRGLHEIADLNYNDAYEKFGKLKKPVAQALCLAYYARSAMKAGHPNAETLLRKALDAYRAAPSSDAAILLRQLSTEIEAPKGDDKMRRLEQWVYDPTSNTLTKKSGISESGAPLLVLRDAKKKRTD